MKQTEFDELLADTTKRIDGDIYWVEDEDHSPTVEFCIEVTSRMGYTLFMKGSYNSEAQTLTYALIHPTFGRIYGLDMGKDHHHPTCNFIGEKHKHSWKEHLKDKEAYLPDDITALVTDPVVVWEQFCNEAHVNHNGVMHLHTPHRPYQGELF